MRVVVCMKQVPDPEGPRESFVVETDPLRVSPQGIPPVLSLFDENALEAALRLKDADPGVHVTVLTVAGRVSDAILFKPLAAGADEVVKVEGEAFEASRLPSHAAALVLASAIKKLPGADLILLGRQAADWNSGQTGAHLSLLLDMPYVTLARKVDVEGNLLVVERLVAGGHEVVETGFPAVVMVSNEVGELRYPGMKARRDAKKKPVNSFKGADLELGGRPASRLSLAGLFQPDMEGKACEFLKAPSGEEAGRLLARKLVESGLI